MERKADKLNVLTFIFILIYVGCAAGQSILPRIFSSSLSGNAYPSFSASVLFDYISAAALITGGILILLRKCKKAASACICAYCLYRLIISVSTFVLLAGHGGVPSFGTELMKLMIASRIIHMVSLTAIIIYTAVPSFMETDTLRRIRFIPGALYSLYTLSIIYLAFRTFGGAEAMYEIGIASVTGEFVGTILTLEIMLVAATVIALTLSFMIPAVFVRKWNEQSDHTGEMKNEKQNS